MNARQRRTARRHCADCGLELLYVPDDSSETAEPTTDPVVLKKE